MSDLEIIIAYYNSCRKGDLHIDGSTVNCGIECDHCSFSRACDALNEDDTDELGKRIFLLLSTPEYSEEHLRQLYPELFV